jgi:hypothetical protein
MEHRFIVGLFGYQDMVENARNLVGGCRDRLRCSQPGSHASEEFSEVPLSAAEGIRSHAKGDCRSVLYLPRLAREYLSATDSLFGTKTWLLLCYKL